MSDKTKISWTDSTWNPIRGCSRVSEGCRNCYAESVAARFSGPGMPYEGLARRTSTGEPRWTGDVRLVEKALEQPLRWKRPRKIFVSSMSDLFHERLNNDDIDRVFAVMMLAPHHTFQVLTKRPHRMRAYMRAPNLYQRILDAAREFRDRRSPLDSVPISNPSLFPARHVWLGVSVENQATADERIPPLLDTPAAVRFLSCEPILGPVDLSPWLKRISHCHDCGAEHPPLEEDRCPWCQREGVLIDTWGEEQAERFRTRERYDNDGPSHSDDGPQIHLVIGGGESGPKARPPHPDWFRSLSDTCVQAGVAFLMKQWGEWGDFTSTSPADMPPSDTLEHRVMLPSGELIGGGRGKHGMVDEHWRERGAAWMVRVGKKRAGRLLDGVEHHAFPCEVPR